MRPTDRPKIAPIADLLPRCRRQESLFYGLIDNVQRFKSGFPGSFIEDNRASFVGPGRGAEKESPLVNSVATQCLNRQGVDTGCSTSPPPTVILSSVRFLPVL